MTIQVDSREKAHAITRILEHFHASRVKYYISKLYIGDYMNLDNPRVIVDRKQNLDELCGNVCRQHERFRAELIRAQLSFVNTDTESKALTMFCFGGIREHEPKS